METEIPNWNLFFFLINRCIRFSKIQWLPQLRLGIGEASGEFHSKLFQYSFYFLNYEMF